MTIQPGQRSPIEWLAQPTTTLGKLQRGTGLGYLEALELPADEAAELVWRCVVREPRWDRQLEARGQYYADLISDLPAFDLERLRPQYCPAPEPDSYDDHRLVVSVLSKLASASQSAGARAHVGVSGAVDVLFDHVAHGDHVDATFAISQLPGGLYTRLPALLAARLDHEGRADIVSEFYDEIPWRELAADHPWINDTLRKCQQRRSEYDATFWRSPPSSLSAQELLAYPWPQRPRRETELRLSKGLLPGELELVRAAARQGTGHTRAIAMRALGVLQDPCVIAVAQDILKRGDPDFAHREIDLATRCFRALHPRDTLELARKWALAEDDRAYAGSCVLAEHGQSRDLPLLWQAVERAWIERDLYSLPDFVAAVVRHSPEPPHEMLCTVFDEGEYSFGRRRLVAALLAANGGVFPARYVPAALWDCEDDVWSAALDHFPRGREPGSRRERRRVELLVARREAEERRTAHLWPNRQRDQGSAASSPQG